MEPLFYRLRQQEIECNMITSIQQDCQQRLTMISNPVSLWDASAEETEISQPFKAESSVDVAIVGGGFTGLSTALHCAEKGLSLQLLEAEQIGYGSSGRN